MLEGGARRLAVEPLASVPAGRFASRWRQAAGGSGFALYALHLWTLFGIALSSSLLGLAVIAAPTYRDRLRVILQRHGDLLAPLSLYVVLLLASVALSRDPVGSVDELGELLSLAAVPVGLAVLDSARRVRRVVDGLVAVAAVVALYGLSQFLVGYGDILHRIRGPFSIYMTFAGFLTLADLLLISQMVYARGWKSPWRWLALAVINLALLGSLTRSAWVALALVTGLLLLVRAPRYLPLFLAALVLIALLAPGPVGERIQSIADLQHPANYDRLCMLDAGRHMIAERPLFGIGPGMVAELFPLYRDPTAVSLEVKHLHNTFVHLAAERGLLSLAAYLWLIGAALAAAWRGWRRQTDEDGELSDLYVGSLLGLLALNLAGLFEHTWGDTEIQRVALLLVVVPFALRDATVTEAAAETAGR